MHRTASVKSNAKFSRLVPSCRNTSSTTVWRKILLLTLLLLLGGRQWIRNVLYGVSKLPTSTLMYFCLSTSPSSAIKTPFLSRSSSRMFAFFGDANIEQRLHGLQFQKVKGFPISTKRVFKTEWFSFWVGYLLLEMKTLLFAGVRSIELYKILVLLTLRAACRFQFSLVKLTFSMTLHKNFFVTFDSCVAKTATYESNVISDYE